MQKDEKVILTVIKWCNSLPNTQTNLNIEAFEEARKVT